MTTSRTDVSAPSATALHRAAVGYLLVSALLFSTAGLFVKGVQAIAWEIVFWRGVFSTLFVAALLGCQGTMARELRAMGRPGVWAAVFGMLGSLAFIPAFKLSTVANVSLIYAAAPFVASVIMWCWVEEKPTRVVLLCSAVAFAGVLLIVAGSLGRLQWRGDALALLMTVCMSAYLCIYRRYPHTATSGPVLLMSGLTAAVALGFCSPWQVAPQDIAAIAVFAAVFCLASISLARGAGRLAASETALISTLETPLALLWAWLLLAEIPADQTFIGGALVLLAVYSSQWLRNRGL